MATSGTITQIPYPSVFTMEGQDDTYIGIKTHIGTDGTYTNFTGAYTDDFHFQVHPQVDPTTRPLIIDLAEYSNGIDLQLEYFTQDFTSLSPPFVRVFGYTKLVDHRTQQEVTIDSPISNSSYYSIDIPLLHGSISRLEQLPCRYYPSVTEYTTESSSQTSAVGDPASNLIMFGSIYVGTNPESHPITELFGDQKNSDLSAFVRSNIANGLIYSGTAYDSALDSLIKAGDGTDPVIDPTIPSDKPYENHPSKPGGGYGGYSGKGDVTGVPGLPSSGTLGSGFIAMYNPSASQLRQLGAKLWSDDFMDNFLKLWNDPMEAIISLGLVPFSPPSTGNTNCYIGNYDTELSLPRVTSQYMTLSCGSVTIEEFWGNALDYGPYTSAEIYLPFVGMRTLDIDDVMNKTVSVDYNVDLLGGEAIAFISVDSRVLYDYRCNMMTSVPISSSSYASLYSGILKGISAAAIGGAMGGGVGAAAGALTSAVNVVTSKHSNIERGGDSTPNSGVLGLLTPYIILHRPEQSLPQAFGRFKGFPSNLTRNLGSLSGYTEIEYIHLDGINATEEEKEEIYSLLKAGVML